jgi:hypothetical protein
MARMAHHKLSILAIRSRARSGSDEICGVFESVQAPPPGVYTTLVTSSVRLILSKFVTSSKFSRFEDCSSLETPRCECSPVQILRRDKTRGCSKAAVTRLLCSLTTTFLRPCSFA